MSLPRCPFAPSSLGWQNGQQRAKRVGVPERDVETHRCKKNFYNQNFSTKAL
jgi:hypothetical protein